MTTKASWVAEHKTINGQPHSEWTAAYGQGVLGWVEKETTDIGCGGSSRAANWKTVGYNAVPADGAEKFFPVDRYGSPRTALAAAKRWIESEAK